MQTKAITVTTQFTNPIETPVYPGRPISVRVNVSINNERFVLEYTNAQNFRYDNQVGGYVNRLKHIKFSTMGTLEIPFHDADLAFFLLYAHPHVESEFECAEIKKIHKSGSADYFYKFVDEHRDAERLVKKEAAKIKVQNLIYNEIDAKTLKSLGVKYKVANTEMLTIPQVQIQLLSKVVSSAENSESYENIYAQFESDYKRLKNLETVEKHTEFATDKEKAELKEEKLQQDIRTGNTDPEFEIEMRLLVEEAVRVGAVKEMGKTSVEASRKYWSYAPKNGTGMGTKIVNIVKADPKDDLFECVKTNKEVRDAIKMLISEKKVG